MVVFKCLNHQSEVSQDNGVLTPLRTPSNSCPTKPTRRCGSRRIQSPFMASRRWEVSAKSHDKTFFKSLNLFTEIIKEYTKGFFPMSFRANKAAVK